MDLAIFNFINQFAEKNAFLDNLAIFFAEYLQYVVALAIFIFLLRIFIRDKQEGVKAGMVIAATVFLSRIIITEVIRHFFFRLRPFIENQATVLIDQSAKEASMPSGHAALFFALATVVYFYNKKLGIFLFVSTFLISISRVFVGIHWPSDILAGALVGIFSGWFIYKISNKLFKQKAS
jgi:undecaprenyl-diphosphatase